MGGIFYFLIIAAILVISYSRQAKRSGNETPRQPDYIPDGKQPQAGSGSPYSQTFPPLPQPATLAPKRKKYTTPLQSGAASKRTYTPVELASTAAMRRPAAIAQPQPTAAGESPYAFHSIEEVRRGFIWMEILRRKY